MVLQSTDSLEKYVGNKYALVILAAKRARQLREGHIPLAHDPSESFLTKALKEIEEKRLQVIAPPEVELAPAPRDLISAIVAGAEFDLDEDMDLEGDAIDDLAAILVGADEEEDEDSDADTDEPARAASLVEDDDSDADESEDADEEEAEDDDVEDEEEEEVDEDDSDVEDGEEA